MMLLLLLLACPPGSLPIHVPAAGPPVCGSWQDLQAYSRTPGPAPEITLPDGGIRVEGGAWVITRATVQTTLRAGLGALARQARLDEVWAGGRIVGFRVVGLPTHSPFRRLGIQSGDVLRSVNGLDLTNPLHMLGLFALLQSPNPSVSLKISRGKQDVLLVWRVEG